MGRTQDVRFGEQPNTASAATLPNVSVEAPKARSGLATPQSRAFQCLKGFT